MTIVTSMEEYQKYKQKLTKNTNNQSKNNPKKSMIYDGLIISIGL